LKYGYWWDVDGNPLTRTTKYYNELGNLTSEKIEHVNDFRKIKLMYEEEMLIGYRQQRRPFPADHTSDPSMAEQRRAPSLRHLLRGT